MSMESMRGFSPCGLLFVIPDSVLDFFLKPIKRRGTYAKSRRSFLSQPAG